MGFLASIEAELKKFVGLVETMIHTPAGEAGLEEMRALAVQLVQQHFAATTGLVNQLLQAAEQAVLNGGTAAPTAAPAPAATATPPK